MCLYSENILWKNNKIRGHSPLAPVLISYHVATCPKSCSSCAVVSYAFLHYNFQLWEICVWLKRICYPQQVNYCEWWCLWSFTIYQNKDFVNHLHSYTIGIIMVIQLYYIHCVKILKYYKEIIKDNRHPLIKPNMHLHTLWLPIP